MRRTSAAIIAALMLGCGGASTVVAQDAAATPDSFETRLQSFLSDPDVKRKQFSADRGDPYSMVWLADELQKKMAGTYISQKQTLPMRVKLYMGAVAKQYPAAFNRMAQLILDGRMPEGGPMDALGFYEKGAKLGDVTSIVGYAKLAQDGFVCSICSQSDKGNLILDYDNLTGGSDSSIKEIGANMYEQRAAAAQAYVNEKSEMARTAITLLSSEAAAKDFAAQDRLARIYLNGIERPNLKNYTGFDSYESKSYLVAPDPPKAKPILIAMGERGQRGGYELLADLYLVGSFEGFPRNRENFIENARLAADAGNLGYAYKLGHTMVTGQTFKADYDIAAKYLHLAHEAGNSAATLDLGFMFYGGRGVPENEETALSLFELAAERGSSKAAETLSQHWREGAGGTRNPMRAKIWADRAVELKVKEERGQETLDALQALAD